MRSMSRAGGGNSASMRCMQRASSARSCAVPPRISGAGCTGSCGGRRHINGVEPSAESAQAGVDADAGSSGSVASNASRPNGRTPLPASAPNSADEITLPLGLGQSPACRPQTNRRDTPCAAAEHRQLIGDAVTGLRSSRCTAKRAMGGGDQRRPVRRHQSALDRPPGFHQFRGDNHVDVAGHRHQREHRAHGCVAGGSFRRSRSSRRCVARRPAPRSIARPSPCASASATIQSASTPPPWPPIAMMAMVIGRSAASVMRPSQASSKRLASRRRCRRPITAWRIRASSRSHRVGLLMRSAR